ncbi:hypothetical protein D3C87_1001740 [compost metagenome]
MYQDNIGSAQVITYEQPVGMLLDTSRQELSTINRAPRLNAATFSGVSGTPAWQFNETYVEATTAFTAGNSAPGVFVVGRIYRCEFEIYDYVSGTVALPYDGLGANNKQIGRSGKFSHMIRPLQGGMFLYSFNFIGKIRNIKVQEIPFSELVTNPGFNTDLSGWTPVVTAGGTVTWSAGTAAIDSGPTIGDTARLRQTIPAIAGMWYEINCYITNWAGSSANNLLQIGSTVGGSDLWSGAIAANGNVRGIFRSTGTSINLQFYCTNEAGVRKTYNLDNVSVRALPGNHLTQATSTARPVLSARLNRLTYSEVIANAAWAKTTSGTGTAPIVTDNFGVAPDGTATAARVQMALNGGTTSADISSMYQAVTVVVGGTYTIGMWLKTNDGTTKAIQMRDDNALGINTIWNVTGTWQFFTASGVTSTTTSTPRLWLRGTQGTADSADLLMWHPQHETGPSLGRYQRIAAATDYDAAGFPSYLRFDGVDDCLFTAGTVDFSGTDKVTVVAAVQKNSDAATAIVVEFSPISTTDGSWYIAAPISAAANFGAASKGTVAQNTPSASPFPSPYRAVLRLQSDIAAPNIRLTINRGSAVAATGTQGTGNFGNHQMFVGRRNNASLQWNGQLYTLHGTGRFESPDSVRVLETYAQGAMA